MKRLLVPLFALGMLLSAASACEVIGSNVAATVGGRDITIDQVRELATAEGAKPSALATATRGLDSSDAQKSLSLWIQVAGSERALAQMGKSPTSADRQSASQKTASLHGVSAETKALLTSGIASANSLLTDLAVDSNPVFHKMALKVLDRIPASQRKLLCSQAIYGPESAADQVQKLLDGGTPIDDPTAFAAAGFSAATTNKQLCVGPSDLPTELAAPYFSAPAGKVERASFTAQASDGSAQTDAFFFKILGTTTLKATSDSVVQAVQKEIQSNPNVLLAPVFKKLAIHVDPRFGSGFDLTRGLIPPESPVVPTTRPNALKPNSQPSTATPPRASAPSSTTTPTG